MEKELIEKAKENLAKSKIPQLFADEVLVVSNTKSGENNEGKIIKEGHITVVFFDMSNQQPIAKVTLSPLTVMNMTRVLSESLEKLNKGLRDENTNKTTPEYIR